MTGADEKAKAAAMARWYRPARCTKCGETMSCLQSVFSDGISAGNCPVRTKRGRCGGRVEFLREKAPEKPKVHAIEVSSPYDVEAELAALDRSIGAVE
jgi:hypothetical protein